MLQTGHDAVGSQNLFCAHIHALVALSHRCSQHAAQIRILAISFADSSPAGIECDIYHRRECPVDAVGTCFLGRYFAYLLHRLGIP